MHDCVSSAVILYLQACHSHRHVHCPQGDMHPLCLLSYWIFLFATGLLPWQVRASLKGFKSVSCMTVCPHLWHFTCKCAIHTALYIALRATRIPYDCCCTGSCRLQRTSCLASSEVFSPLPCMPAAALFLYVSCHWCCPRHPPEGRAPPPLATDLAPLQVRAFSDGFNGVAHRAQVWSHQVLSATCIVVQSVCNLDHHCGFFCQSAGQIGPLRLLSTFLNATKAHT
jgi:hypothetical protein